MREIKKIIIHCSDSEFGDLALINKWHQERGFDSCGYHYVIGNGFIDLESFYEQDFDGLVEPGRPLETVGAHTKGENHDSIGICLIGRRLFSANQLLHALPDVLISLMIRFNLPIKNIYGHSDFNNSKTCPNFDVELIRRIVAARLGVAEIAKESKRLQNFIEGRI